jgi:hypothetical protein
MSATNNIEDHLTEDYPVPNQTFFVLSYLLANKSNPESFPMIKVRGSYRTLEECQKRIDTLKNIDPYFNLYIAEVGKWGGLYEPEKVANMQDVDVVYYNKTMNTLMSEYKKNKEAQQDVFEQRKNKMKTGEGSSEIESVEDVEIRAKALEDQIKDLTEKLNDVKMYKERCDLDLAKLKSE